MNACADYLRILYGGGRLLAGNQQVIAVPGILRPITMSGVLVLAVLAEHFGRCLQHRFSTRYGNEFSTTVHGVRLICATGNNLRQTQSELLGKGHQHDLAVASIDGLGGSIKTMPWGAETALPRAYVCMAGEVAPVS